jgi:hypothetical protein
MFTLTNLKKEYIKEKDDIHWLAAVIAPQVHFFAHGQYASDDRRADRHTRDPTRTRAYFGCKSAGSRLAPALSGMTFNCMSSVATIIPDRTGTMREHALLVYACVAICPVH